MRIQTVQGGGAMKEECIWTMSVKGIGICRESSVMITRRMDWKLCGDAPYEDIHYDVRAYLGMMDTPDQLLRAAIERWEYEDGGFAGAQRYAMELASWVIHAITLPSLAERVAFIEAAHETWSTREVEGG
jgi:hypothetical protein